MESHSGGDRRKLVRYVDLPMDNLLTRWFGESWKTPEPAHDASTPVLVRIKTGKIP
jgi:hypothetical protein